MNESILVFTSAWQKSALVSSIPLNISNAIMAVIICLLSFASVSKLFRYATQTIANTYTFIPLDTVCYLVSDSFHIPFKKNRSNIKWTKGENQSRSESQKLSTFQDSTRPVMVITL